MLVKQHEVAGRRSVDRSEQIDYADRSVASQQVVAAESARAVSFRQCETAHAPLATCFLDITSSIAVYILSFVDVVSDFMALLSMYRTLFAKFVHNEAA